MEWRRQLGYESPVLSVPVGGEREANGDQRVDWRYPCSVMLLTFPWLLVTQVRGFSAWMMLDHPLLLNLKLWITKLRAYFERLWIPRIRPLKLVRTVE